MYATKIYRIGNLLYKKKFEKISKLFSYFNNILNNCSISSECEIGQGSYFAHGGIGVVINKESKIGKNVLLGQGITIGGKNGEKPPIINDNVYVGPGARILGNIEIGKYSIIAPNSVVLSNVEEFTIVAGVPSKVIGKITKENINKYTDYFANKDIKWE